VRGRISGGAGRGSCSCPALARGTGSAWGARRRRARGHRRNQDRVPESSRSGGIPGPRLRTCAFAVQALRRAVRLVSI
jgi:hypothetical protein